MLLKQPAAREKKPEFAALPPTIFRQLEKLCGGKIVSSDVAFGGLSASAGFVMTLDSGRNIFAKGTHPAETAHGAANLAQEIAAYETLAVLRTVSPPYLGIVSDGEQDGWMLGVWDFVAHDPGLASAQRVTSGLRQCHAAQEGEGVLIPARTHGYIGFFFNNEKKWLRLRHDANIRKKFLAMFEDVTAAGKWCDKSIPVLCDYQARIGKIRGREGLLHGDLRLDNFLFSGERNYIVDWPNASYGPLVFDLCFLLSNLEAMGMGKTDELMTDFDWVDWDDVIAMLAALSGYFADQAYRDVPDRMPRLRWMQQSMLLAQLKTLARLGIIESPPKMQGENQ